MTRFSRTALALGTAAAIATTASAFAGPIGPSGAQVKQAVPAGATDVRIRRGAAIAAGVAIGIGAAAIAANSNYGYGGYGYGYAEPYGYDDGGYATYGYGPSYGYGYGYAPAGYNGYCQQNAAPERSTC